MPRRMLECTETVIMEDGSQTFTKGNLYRPYKYLSQSGWDVEEVLCAKNDDKERHIIRHEDDDSFYKKHFKEVIIDGKK
jgi:hypothetical protein